MHALPTCAILNHGQMHSHRINEAAADPVGQAMATKHVDETRIQRRQSAALYQSGERASPALLKSGSVGAAAHPPHQQRARHTGSSGSGRCPYQLAGTLPVRGPDISSAFGRRSSSVAPLAGRRRAARGMLLIHERQRLHLDPLAAGRDPLAALASRQPPASRNGRPRVDGGRSAGWGRHSGGVRKNKEAVPDGNACVESRTPNLGVRFSK